MNTHIESTDPRLMDFVLGELDEETSRELARLLQAPENAEARKEVEALREVVRAANTALQTEAADKNLGLSPSSRNTILEKARTREIPWRMRWNAYRVTALAATLLLCLGGVWLYMSMGDPKALIISSELFRVAALQEIAHNETSVNGLSTSDINIRVPSDALPEPDSEKAGGRGEIMEYRDAHERYATAGPGPDPSVVEGRPLMPPPSMPPASKVAPSDTEQYSVQSAQDVHMRTSAAPVADDGAEHLQALGYLPSPSPVSMPVIPPPDRRPYPGGEQYSVIEERPFANAADQPLSTFSLHPDGAAYANIRRMLQQGQLPPRDAVRIEEIVNYFDYGYPQPVGEHPFTVNIEVGPCPWASGHLLAKIGLQGRDIPRDERPPANLIFLIDTSGSMDRPNRLPLVKESLKALLDELDPRDRVGIVTYAGQSLTALDSTPLTERSRIMSAIDALRASGSTHGSAGIQDAYAMAQKHFIKDGINRVIIATDGDFNVGVTSREGLLSLIEEKRRTGVFLTVLGYGMGNLKDGTLELLATKGNGNYAYIDDYAEARRVLVEQLSGTLTTIAKDAKIQVEFNPAQVRFYRLLGYENRMMAHRDFHDDTKDAGEIGAGHTVTALYQIAPHGAALDPGVDNLRYQTPEPAPPVAVADGAGELMFVKLRYKQPDSETSRLIEIPVPARALTLEQSSADYRFAAAAAGFGLLLRDSAHKGDATFDLVRQLAASAVNNNHRREELLNLIVTAKTLRRQ